MRTAALLLVLARSPQAPSTLFEIFVTARQIVQLLKLFGARRSAAVKAVGTANAIDSRSRAVARLLRQPLQVQAACLRLGPPALRAQHLIGVARPDRGKRAPSGENTMRSTKTFLAVASFAIIGGPAAL